MLQQVCNVHTVQDLYQQRGLVQWLFQPATAEFLLRACVGCSGSNNSSSSSFTSSDFGMDDDEPNTVAGDASAGAATTTSDQQKGISRERTFSSESDWSQLCMRLEDIARKLFQDMTHKAVLAHTVTVKVKLTSFDVLSKGQSMKRGVYIQSPEELVDCASQLFAQIRSQFKKDHAKDGSRFFVRLLGIRCSNLISESLFQSSSEQGSMNRYLTTTPLENGNEWAKSDDKESDPCKNRDDSKVRTVNMYVHRNNVARRIRSPIHGRHHGLGNDDRGGTTSVSSTAGISTPRILLTPNEKEQFPINRTVAKERVNCPLCSREFPADDNAGLNSHIDTCLNSSTVRRAIEEVDLQRPTQPASRKPKRLTDFWTSSS